MLIILVKWAIAGKNYYREKHVYIPLWLSMDHVTCGRALTNICTMTLSHQLAQCSTTIPITIIDCHQSCHTMTMTMMTTPLHDSRHIVSCDTNDDDDDDSHLPNHHQ